MTNDQVVQELKYLIAKGVPPPVEGVLQTLIGALCAGHENKMHKYLIPFCKQMLSEIQQTKNRLN